MLQFYMEDIQALPVRYFFIARYAIKMFKSLGIQVVFWINHFHG